MKKRQKAGLAHTDHDRSVIFTSICEEKGGK